MPRVADARIHSLGLSALSALWALLSLVTINAHAATVWNESINGDFSNNGLAPTAVSMVAGSNTVLGATGDSGLGVDRDYFKFTVPAGSFLDSITLLPNTAVSGGVSFIGIQPGPQVTVSPTGAGASALIALGHYDNSQIGFDLLAAINISGGRGLPAGEYAVWVQDTGGPATYGFSFNISAVPEPATAGLWAIGLLGLGTLRARRPVSAS